MARRRFRDLPIRRKLTVVYVLTSGVALLLASTALLGVELVNFRSSMVDDAATQAQIIGYNVASAVVFNDRSAAENTLAAMQAEPHIVAAGVYKPDGTPFATFVRQGTAVPAELNPATAPQESGHAFQRDYLLVYRSIAMDGEVIGHVRLLYDLQELQALLLQYTEIMIVVFVASLIAALPVLSALQRLISGPIMHLVEKARIVSTEQNYAVRATRTSADELGLLVDTFNEMLGQIQERDVALESARDAAETANRAKDEFLAVVSHELRTPLTPILAWTRMLSGGQLDSAGARRAVEIIERNVMSQAQLIEDLLDVSRIITGKLRLDVQHVEIAPIVEAAIDSVRPTADLKGVRIRVVIDPRAGTLSGDAERLKQVVWNLLSNAVKFTPKGGQVQVLLQRVNSHVEISVSDTGEGIAPEFLPFVFDRFRQADASSTRAHGGLGVGLAIVRNLVELHGGRTHAASPGVGEGATFTVELPVTLLPAPAIDRVHPAARSTAAPVANTNLDGLCVLAVDDDPDTLDMLRAVLEQHGAVVRTAPSAREGLRVLDEWQPHVLISDLGMPQVDGYEFIRRVRQRVQSNARIPALALTAYARVEDRLQVLAAGFQMHVAKPIEPAELVAVVASLAGWTTRQDAPGAD